MRRMAALMLLASFCEFCHADDINSQIGSMFSAYNQPGAPGCNVGVIQNGQIIYRTSFGNGSVELGVPLTFDGSFYLASVSKQFTAASIVLASEQGYLALDDNVRKYIPELPDYGTPITIRELLHQTSGVRDFLALTFLAGRDIDTLSSPSDVLSLISKQKQLNNVPGTEFIYSNSNYFLLGVVVQRATKRTLATFAADNIFRPLGMTHTLFYDDKGIIVHDRVAGYRSLKDGTLRADWSNNFSIVGSGGLMSTLGDLALWDQSFYSHKLGRGSLVDELEIEGNLADGHRIKYGLGLWLGRYRGLRTVEHSGGTFGYRSEILRFPDQNLSVVELCNVSGIDVEGIARKIADLYLGQEEVKSSATTKSTHSYPDAKTFAGTYLDGRTHLVYRFTEIEGKLIGWGASLDRIGPDEFTDLSGNPIRFAVSGGEATATLMLGDDPFFVGKRIAGSPPIQESLNRYVGSYVSDELGATYTVRRVADGLSLAIGSNEPSKLLPLLAGEFEAPGLGVVAFRPPSDNSASELVLYSAAVRNVAFRKVM